jgi:hypothetical protein
MLLADEVKDFAKEVGPDAVRVTSAGPFKEAENSS